MIHNLAFQEDPWKEILNGKTFLMSRPSVNHNRVAGNIFVELRNYLKGKSCEAFGDGTDVYIREHDRVIPDVMIVCDKDIIKKDGIHGVPDFIVEVLSPSTTKNDRGYKKSLYEKAGVQEYWIIEPETRSIEAYLLINGRYELDEVYAILPDYMNLTDEERMQYKDEVPVSLYDGFTISLDDVFYGLS